MGSINQLMFIGDQSAGQRDICFNELRVLLADGAPGSWRRLSAWKPSEQPQVRGGASEPRGRRRWELEVLRAQMGLEAPCSFNPGNAVLRDALRKEKRKKRSGV